MAKTAKIAISLPAELLRSIEQARRVSGESRSELFRRAVEFYLRLQREREAIDRYVQGYRLQPETGEETALAESTVQQALSESPWETGSGP